MDELEFVALFRNHLNDISRYLSRRVATSQVEDLASEIFEIAWRKRADCPRDFELPWLYRIAGFVLANHRRKSENRFIHLPILDSDRSSPSAEDLALDGSDIARAFHLLSPSDRQILSLLVFEGLSISEIAVVLELSANTVSQKIKRARDRLAKKLDQVVSENQ